MIHSQHVGAADAQQQVGVGQREQEVPKVWDRAKVLCPLPGPVDSPSQQRKSFSHFPREHAEERLGVHFHHVDIRVDLEPIQLELVQQRTLYVQKRQ